MFITPSSEEFSQRVASIWQQVAVDDIEDALSFAAKAAAIVTSAEAVAIRRFDLDTGTLKICSSYGFEKEQLLPSQFPIKIGEGVTGRAVLEGKPFVHSDVRKAPHWTLKDSVGFRDAKSVMVLPLKDKETCSGCISVYRRTEQPFQEQDAFLASLLGVQAGEIIKNRKLVQELQKQATVDYLTQVYNKNGLYAVLENQLCLSKRHSNEMSIIFLDIDDFKQFNDRNGHLLGDKLLCDFVRVLARECRKSDSIGRFGGEEFIVLAPHTSKDSALTFANKLREAIEKNSFLGKEDEKVRITFSAGVSTFPQDGEDMGTLLMKADYALYQSKGAGKNQVTGC